MLAVIQVLVILAVIVFLLNRKVTMALAMLAGSAVLFLWTGPTVAKLADAAYTTVTTSSTWEIILALFFVMCLEYQLRTGGIIDGLMAAARKIFRSERVLLVIMPSFLGFLPSLGGAIFSAPLVESAGKTYGLSADAKTTVNYWFRHVWEFSNPIFTGMLLASQLSGFTLSELVISMSWITVFCLVIGWIFLIAPLRPLDGAPPPPARQPGDPSARRAVALALGPILANFVLVVAFKLSAAVSMAVVVAAMALILRQDAAAVGATLRRALDGRMLWGILSILFFQNILRLSGLVTDITALLNSIAIPAGVIVGVIAFVGGLLTGTSQGFVAICFPFIALLAPGDMSMVMIAFVAGEAGHMLSPAHMCLLVTLDYFDADFLRSLKPIFLLETALIAFACGVISFWA
jgi:integral membrane protein (TIGR00529 family)